MVTTSEVQQASAGLLNRVYHGNRHADVLVVRDPGSPGMPIEPGGVHRLCTASFVPEFAQGPTRSRFDAVVVDMEIADHEARQQLISACRSILKPCGILLVRGLGGNNARAEQLRTGLSYTPLAGYGVLLASTDRKVVFQQIYALDVWNGGSGPGSDPKATCSYRQVLQTCLDRIKQLSPGRRPRIVDIGCGDWQFSQLIDWTGVDYLGIDACQPVIAENTRKFATDSIRFEYADAVNKTDWGAPDLVLVKDVLQHLSNESISTLLENLIAGEARLLLSTNDDPLDEPIIDCADGGYRPIALSKVEFLRHLQHSLIQSNQLPIPGYRPKLAEMFSLLQRSPA